MSSILESTYNTRFISKSDTNSLLIRSDKIDECSRQEIAFLHSIGITTVIDLRDLTNKRINPYLSTYEMNFINCPMSVKADKQAFMQQYGGHGHCFEYYTYLLTQYERIASVFAAINQDTGGILINCSAGRDRTGIVSFLIELLGEFDMQYIIRDMAISDTNLLSRTNTTNIVLQSNLDYEFALKRGERLYYWFFSTFDSISDYFSRCGIKEHEYVLLVNRIKLLMKTI